MSGVLIHHEVVTHVALPIHGGRLTWYEESNEEEER